MLNKAYKRALNLIINRFKAFFQRLSAWTILPYRLLSQDKALFTELSFSLNYQGKTAQVGIFLGVH